MTTIVCRNRRLVQSSSFSSSCLKDSIAETFKLTEDSIKNSSNSYLVLTNQAYLTLQFNQKHQNINSNALTMHFITLDLFVLPSFLLPCPPALCNLLAPHILYFYIVILLHHRELTTYTLFITDFFPIFSFSPLGPTGSGLFLKFWL